MTNKEAFLFKAGENTSEQEAINALNFAGVDPDGIWDATADNCAFYSSLIDNVLKGGGVEAISQGDYSVRYTKGDMKNYAYELAKESGCKDLIDKYDPQPKIINKSYLW